MGSEFNEDNGVTAPCRQDNAFFEIKKDKLLLSLFIIIILLGVAVRFVYPTEPGLWNDDVSTLPTGLLWFYPHDSYPGLSGQGEPALGNLFFGAGCMLSGEDFSSVAKIKPMWYPDRPLLFGKELIAAEDYCRIPSYFFGLLLFFAVILLSLSFLDKFSALFCMAFFAFYQHILQFSRWIHVDIMLYVFIAFGLFFLWKSFSSAKYSKKEMIYFAVALLFFALSFATKLPALIYLFVAFVLLFLKYNAELLLFVKKVLIWLGIASATKIKEKTVNFQRLALVSFVGIAIYVISLLPAFEFSFKNVWLVIAKYKATDAMQGSAIGGIALNKEFWAAFHGFLLSLNLLDILLLILSLYSLFALLLKKKGEREIFFLLLLALFAAMLAVFPAMNLLRVFISFSFGLLLLMSLAASNTEYSPLKLLGLQEKKFRAIFILFMAVYISFSAYTAFSNAPYFEYRNSLVCNGQECIVSYSSFGDSQLGQFLQELVSKNNATTFDNFGISGISYYYARPEEGQEMLFWRESFRQQAGRMPNVKERITLFRPLNRTIQYLPFDPNLDYGDEFIKELKSEYIPNYKIMLKHGFEAIWVYDMNNLTKH